MRRIYFLLFVLLSGLAFAGNVPEEQARKAAIAFWQSAPLTRGASSATFQMVLQSENLVTRSSGMESAYYVFDNTSGPGFVIVAGDDVAMPILAYSFENEFPTREMPENLKGWLDGMRKEINYARRHGAKASAYVSRAWAATSVGTPVVELETAQWNQEAPYNNLCPQVNLKKTYTGCTATALAIVMKYHEWPLQGAGTLPGYTTTTYKANIESLPLGHTYDWGNMRMEYSLLYTAQEAEAVATLMRDCAIGIQSDFGPVGSSGTGAYPSDIPSFLVDHMGYDRACRAVYRVNYNTADWNQLMKNELDNRRPVLFGGSSGVDGSGGHAFVLDGYDTNNYFSVNWGWGGMSDGYFLLSALDPNAQGAGGSDSGFNYYQDAVIGIQPDAGGDYVEELGLQNYENPTEGVFVHGLEITSGIPAQNEPFNLQFGFLYNSGSASFTGEVMVAVTDKEGKIVESLGTLPVENLPVGYGYPQITADDVIITTPVLDGYRIRLFYRTAKKPEWTLIRANDEEGCVWDLVISDLIGIDKNTTLTYNKADRIIRLHTLEGVTATLKAADGTDYSAFCKKNGTEISIDTSSLPGGRYDLTLAKGANAKTVTFVLPEVK